MYEWSDVRFFLAVARAGSTLAASRSLRVNQTTVVRRIEALEAALRLRLFDRTQEGYRLSEAGQQLLAQTERMEAEAVTLERLAAQRGRAMSGAIRVTTMEAFATIFLTPMLAEFMEMYPGIKVELISAEHRLDLARGDADIAIRAGRMPSEPGIVVRKLADDPWAVYCSSAYAARYGAPASHGALDSHFVIGGEGLLAKLAPFMWLAEAVPSAKVRSACTTVASTLAAIRAGHGVGMLPMSAVGLTETDLVECFTLPNLGNAYYLATRADMKDVPRIKAFCDFIVPRVTAIKPALEGRTRGKA